MSDSPLAAARNLSALWAGIGVPAGRPIAGCTVSLPALPALLHRIRDGTAAARQATEARLADRCHAPRVGVGVAKSISVRLIRRSTVRPVRPFDGDTFASQNCGRRSSDTIASQRTGNHAGRGFAPDRKGLDSPSDTFTCSRVTLSLFATPRGRSRSHDRRADSRRLAAARSWQAGCTHLR